MFHLHRRLLSTASIPTKTAFRLHPQTSVGQQFRLSWPAATPQTILLVKKPDDRQVDTALIQISQWIRRQYPQINLVLEPQVARQLSQQLPCIHTAEDPSEYSRVVDFVITLGGDGTFLHVSSLFPKEVPPIAPFSMGTLGFLLPFDVRDFPRQLKEIVEGSATVLPRMRLEYTKRALDGAASAPLSITNEVCIHRATYPHLTTLSCFLDSHLLTTSVGDGIIVGTPTGSTAYSLSAGGPIVHPSVSSILVAPVCPRSLSFRPLMLPAGAVVRLQVHPRSRGRATAFLDGRDGGELLEGEAVEVRQSGHPLLCVNRRRLAEGWAEDINQLLKFNRTFSYPHEVPFSKKTE